MDMQRDARVQTHDLYGPCDDLHAIANAHLAAQTGPSAIVVVRNEGYFLPRFLDHYRRLGVDRFVVLDDRSDDGSREFLAAQPDVLLLASARDFGEPVFPDDPDPARRRIRMVHAWRTLMLHRFALDRWALVLDADEFVVLPEGMDVPELFRRAEGRGIRGVAGVMLDLYPEDIAGLRHAAPFDPDGGWFFDGEPHLKLNGGDRPAILHHGVRARLRSHYLKRETGFWRLLRRLRRGNAYRAANWTFKVPMVKWQAGDAFLDSHWPALPIDAELLLPIKHYKFTPDLYRRVQHALATGGYAFGSSEYRKLDTILRTMEARGGRFVYARSRPAAGFEVFAQTGNGRLP